MQIAILLPVILLGHKCIPGMQDNGTQNLNSAYSEKGWMKEGYNHYLTYGSLHLTICFNLLILLQVANMMNCKELRNKFGCFTSFKDPSFCFCFFGIILIQILALLFGSRLFRTKVNVRTCL